MSAPATTDPRPAPVERLAYNAEETAQALGISLVTLWRLEKRGLLKPSRALRHPRWSRTEIERFLEETK
ncbi:MAG: helix-turn-helix domain-containing protein [Chthoniobacterales bacterium]|nr:helix-turn-helix domain-containing protein [Chthoniobacterales bacterium]